MALLFRVNEIDIPLNICFHCPTMRVFAGIPLPMEAKEGINTIIQHIKGQFPTLTFPRLDGLHITVHFFGDLDEVSVDQLISGMDRLRSFSPISCTLGGLGQFPPKGNPRVVFVHLTRGSDHIRMVYKNYGESIRLFPFVKKNNKPFHPHITVARDKRSSVDPEWIKKYPPLSLDFTLECLVLYKSRLTPRGAEYTPLKTIPFR